MQQFWYIRVKKGGQWSTVYTGNNGNPVLNAPKLTIGTPPLLCGQGSSAGNFGTLKLSHPAIAAGTTSVRPTWLWALRTPWRSIRQAAPQTVPAPPSQTTSVLWNVEGTNCVDTDTGMSAKVATGGFLGKGSSAVSGTSTC